MSDSETFKRENRRIAAMSWGGSDGDMPPPKPSRTPMTGELYSIILKILYNILFNNHFIVDSTSKLFLGTDEKTSNGSPQTYIIAQNPTVLAHLMREQEQRGINPNSYTSPASVFNVLAVEIDEKATENKNHYTS